MSASPSQMHLFGQKKVEPVVPQSEVRRRILRVAKQRFARFSYDGVTLASIARGADVPLAELLLHFDSKLTLLLAVFDEGWASINLRFADIVITSVTARDAMLSMLAVMTHILEKDLDLARLLLFEGRRPNPVTGQIMLSKGYRELVRLCVELAVRGQKDGSFRNAFQPRVIATLLIGAAESLLRDRIIAEQEEDATPYSGAQMLAAYDALVSFLKPAGPQRRPRAVELHP